jgi:hypothetical protein
MMPDPKSPTLIERFGLSLSRFAATLEYNLDSGHPKKLLERRVVADHGLPMSTLPAFEAYARGKTADFLLELDNWLSAKIEGDERPADGTECADAGVNVFLYVDENVANPQQNSPAGSPFMS